MSNRSLSVTVRALLLAGWVGLGLPVRAQAPAASPTRDLSFYLTQARQNSPLSADVRNQGRAVQLETERLRAFYTKANGTLVGNYTAVPVLTRDNGRTRLSYAADATTNNYVGYDVALSNGALYQGYAQLTQPLFNQKRFEAYAQQAQGLARSQQNLSQLSLHDLEKLVGDQYILCRQDLDQLSYVRELLGILDKQRLLVRKLVEASLLKQSDYALLSIEVETQQLFLNTYRTAYHRDLLDLNVLCGLGDTAEVALAPPDLPLRRTGPAPGLSGFTTRYRLDSLTLAANQRVFELRYKPLVNAFANGGLEAVTLADIPQRFGVSAGLQFSVYLFDGHQRQTSRDRARVLLETTRAYQQNFATINPVRQQRLLYEVRQLDERQRLAREQIASYRQVLDSYKREVIAGQLSVVNYVQVLKNYAAAARDLVLLENNRLLLINAYNYWTW
ncbi:TolC family protein [Hymenobacter sp. BRD128]|uniref:TolC family protein n=1 Tax=Hymenobacter sp. BRD128 TaxID=2675878 RepID=UPI00156309EC|nr:TolC family protein [Hymenobacter sp. BRD128]QKG57536.1 TolC family protein [Hymenobacter sp. BRD128]